MSEPAFCCGDTVSSIAVRRCPAFVGKVTLVELNGASPPTYFYHVFGHAGLEWHRDASELTLVSKARRA